MTDPPWDTIATKADLVELEARLERSIRTSLVGGLSIQAALFSLLVLFT